MITQKMLHTQCATSWTLTDLTWTSCLVRNQDTCRVQIKIKFKENFGFEFHSDLATRMAVTPNLPIDPNERSIREEMDSRNKRNRQPSSPTESVAPPTKRRAMQTQTDIYGEHLSQVTRKYKIGIGKCNEFPLTVIFISSIRSERNR